MKIQRYELLEHWHGVEEDDQGSFVRYTDHLQVLRAIYLQRQQRVRRALFHAALAMLAIVAFCVWSDPAGAQTREVRSLLSDRGWHGVGAGVQVHQPTLEFKAPWIGVWERSARADARDNPYGEWTYVKVLVNCQQWSQIPLATLNEDWRMVFIEDLTGEPPAARWPEPDSVSYRTMTALCALYGYARQATPVLTPNPGGEPYIGGIRRVDKP